MPIESRRLATAIFAVIAVFALAGGVVIYQDTYGTHWDLDGDWTYPAAFSALLLAAAAYCAYVVGERRVLGLRHSAYLLAAILLFMALDEAFSFHERIEDVTDVDWQILYAPVFLVCGIGWLNVTRALGRLRPAQALMVGGALAWLVAQVLEKVEWSGDPKVAAYDALMFAEEILEMAGTAAMLIALYMTLEREPEPGSAGRS